MRERLAKLLEEKHLSGNKFAEIIGVQPSGLSHILNGRNMPGYDFIVRTLNHFPDINPDWLLLGEGIMYRNDSTAEMDATPLLMKDKNGHEVNDSTDLTTKDNALPFPDEAQACKLETKDESSAYIDKMSSDIETPLKKTSSPVQIIILNEDKTAEIYKIK